MLLGLGLHIFLTILTLLGLSSMSCLLGLKFSSWQCQAKLEDLSLDYNLLEDQVYRLSLIQEGEAIWVRATMEICLRFFSTDVGSLSFEIACGNFIRSTAGYAVASLLLQLKDHHNGNLLFDNSTGRLVHIDFGFIFGTSPGGNMHFENAQFKLSHDMTRLLDPSGSKKSETWMLFVSGLPCFNRGDPVGNFCKRFLPEMSEGQAATFVIHACEDAYNKWTTALYDSMQYWQNGIKK